MERRQPMMDREWRAPLRAARPSLVVAGHVPCDIDRLPMDEPICSLAELPWCQPM